MTLPIFNYPKELTQAQYGSGVWIYITQIQNIHILFIIIIVVVDTLDSFEFLTL